MRKINGWEGLDDLQELFDLEFEEFCEDGDDPLEEHFEAIIWLQDRWRWYGGKGQFVDLRKINIQYVISLVAWMEKHNSPNTPYVNSPQYCYLQEKLKKNQKWIDLARQVLKPGKLRLVRNKKAEKWQAQEMLHSTHDSSRSSRETPDVASR